MKILCNNATYLFSVKFPIVLPELLVWNPADPSPPSRSCPRNEPMDPVPLPDDEDDDVRPKESLSGICRRDVDDKQQTG